MKVKRERNLKVYDCICFLFWLKPCGVNKMFSG